VTGGFGSSSAVHASVRQAPNGSGIKMRLRFVKADCIDRRVGAGQHIGNTPLVSNVRLDRLKTRIVGTE
jgi:hypothetical protein